MNTAIISYSFLRKVIAPSCIIFEIFFICSLPMDFFLMKVKMTKDAASAIIPEIISNSSISLSLFWFYKNIWVVQNNYQELIFRNLILHIFMLFWHVLARVPSDYFYRIHFYSYWDGNSCFKKLNNNFFLGFVYPCYFCLLSFEWSRY